MTKSWWNTVNALGVFLTLASLPTGSWAADVGNGPHSIIRLESGPFTEARFQGIVAGQVKGLKLSLLDSPLNEIRQLSLLAKGAPEKTAEMTAMRISAGALLALVADPSLAQSALGELWLNEKLGKENRSGIVSVAQAIRELALKDPSVFAAINLASESAPHKLNRSVAWNDLESHLRQLDRLYDNSFWSGLSSDEAVIVPPSSETKKEP